MEFLNYDLDVFEETNILIFAKFKKTYEFLKLLLKKKI